MRDGLYLSGKGAEVFADELLATATVALVAQQIFW